MSRGVDIAAPAKLNLTLEVLGKRPDGYHELRSVVATIDLADRVHVAKSRELVVRISPDVGAAPGTELAARAARLLAQTTGCAPGVFVHVRKRIPVAAGLGGGSSDAAAVLRALADLWRVGDVDLVRLAAEVGSDVPFFASGARYAFVAGRGEIVEPLPIPSAAIHAALVRIPARVATADVFAARQAREQSDGSASRRLRVLFLDGAVTPSAIRGQAVNDLLAAAERVCPQIAHTRARAAARGITLALSGSGPTLFAIADDKGDALRIARMLRRDDLTAHAVVFSNGAARASQ